MRLPVLLYHHVGPLRPGTFHELTVPSDRFERHIEWLARHGYVGIGPSEWLAWRRQGAPLPEKPVLCTFDDGYADLVEHALPVLRRHDFGAAVFVVTGDIGGENQWDQARGSQPHRLMTAGQIREWSAHGIEFGAHSRTHPDLTTLSGPQLDEEIQGSRDDLSAVTGRAVVSFAYPYGRVNDAVAERARAVFDCAFSCQEGVNTGSSDLHALRRSMVQPGDTLLALACRMRFGRNPAHEWRARLRIRSRFKQAARCFEP